MTIIQFGGSDPLPGREAGGPGFTSGATLDRRTGPNMGAARAATAVIFFFMTASPWVRKRVVPSADFVASLTLKRGGSLRWIASLQSRDGVQPLVGSNSICHGGAFAPGQRGRARREAPETGVRNPYGAPLCRPSHLVTEDLKPGTRRRIGVGSAHDHSDCAAYPCRRGLGGRHVLRLYGVAPRLLGRLRPPLGFRYGSACSAASFHGCGRASPFC